MKNHSSTMQSTCSISSENLMESRLHVGELGLQSIHVDVGNAGDCFLRSVSHQLYDNSNHHMRKRTLLLGFNLWETTQRDLLKVIPKNSWLRYLNNMSIQGAWADALTLYRSSSCRCIKSYSTNPIKALHHLPLFTQFMTEILRLLYNYYRSYLWMPLLYVSTTDLITIKCLHLNVQWI